MVEDVYRKLQLYLHRYPMGYPSTESGVDIELLRRLFEKEEAELALGLTPRLETPGEIADRLGLDPTAVAERLHRMAKKGLVMRRVIGSDLLFNSIPFNYGISSFQIARLDKDLVELLGRYGEQGLAGEVFGSKTPYFRVIPVERNLPAEVVVFPYEKISEFIHDAEKIGVTDCICRTRRNMLGTGCGRTLQTCLLFSHVVDYFMGNGWPGRVIGKEEALEILNRSEEDGLVHISQNVATRPEVICNCCSCCCTVISTLRKLNWHARVGRAYYFSRLEEGLCVGCGQCIDRCQFGALSLDNQLARISRDLCMGCGLCVSSCPTNALALVRRQDNEIASIPSHLGAMYRQIGKEKGRDIHLAVNNGTQQANEEEKGYW